MTTSNGFVRADGQGVVDDSGELLLRGVGLGGWLLPEGYMFLFGDEMSAPHQIEQRITSLIGHAASEEFFARFRSTFITEHDIATIASLGFDHVRLPINARVIQRRDGSFIEAGFALIEDTVRWCETHGLRVILDLHGAPGGQTGTNIDDSFGSPDLFLQPGNVELTVALWRELATRYVDRPAVLAYDLLNEPLPNEWQFRFNDELVGLYRTLTAAIRDIDDRHMLMYEGSHWATNWTPLRDRFDDNQVLQFHRYWCPPDVSSIDEYLQARERLNTPIFMGEGGENTPEWIYAMTRLYERHNIGWNHWPWKKLETTTSPLSIVAPSGWSRIADPHDAVPAAHAQRILDNFLAAIPTAQQRPAVLDALFAQHQTSLPAWAGAFVGEEHVIAERVSGGSDSVWHHPSGEPYRDSEHPAMRLHAGETLRFALNDQPRGASVRAHPSEAVTVTVHETGIDVTATANCTVDGIDIQPCES